MVFCRTKRTAQKVADELVDRGFAAAAVHGDLGQGAREQALRAFRSGKVDVLVATDVAARGIDVTGVSHVVNYQCPEDEKTYLHRIGRTGRAGREGVAVTFVDWDDMPRWQLINKALDLRFHEPPETYSTSPWVYTDLDIPTTATGPAAPLAADPRGPGRRERRGPRRDRQAQPPGRPAVATAAATAGAARVATAAGDGARDGAAEGTAGGGKSRPRRRTRGSGRRRRGGRVLRRRRSPWPPRPPTPPRRGRSGRPRRRRRRGGSGRGGGGAERR